MNCYVAVVDPEFGMALSWYVFTVLQPNPIVIKFSTTYELDLI